MELFTKPSSDRLSSSGKRPSHFAKRSVSLGPSDMVGQGGVTRDQHPQTEGVTIDEVTRLERCPITGDWRFVTIPQDASVKLKGNNCDALSTAHAASPYVLGQSLCLPHVRLGSADQKQSRRRRRYSGLKLEDMGIKIQDETNSCTNADNAVKDSEEMLNVATPTHCSSTNLRLQASEGMPPSPHSIEFKDSRNRLFSSEHCRHTSSSSVCRANDGLLSERRDYSTAVSGLSPNKSNSDPSSILSSNSRPCSAAEHVVTTSENCSNDVFMENSSLRTTERSTVNVSCGVEAGLRHISIEKNSNMDDALRESHSDLNNRGLRSVSNLENSAISDDSKPGFSSGSLCSEIHCACTVSECNKTFNVGCRSSQDEVQMSCRSDQFKSGRVRDVGYSMPIDVTCDGRGMQCIEDNSIVKHPNNVEGSQIDGKGMNEKCSSSLVSSAAADDDDDEKDTEAEENETIYGNLHNTECDTELTSSLCCEKSNECTVQEPNDPSSRSAITCSDKMNVVFMNENDDKTSYEDKGKFTIERPTSLTIGNGVGVNANYSTEMSSSSSSNRNNNRILHRSFPCHDIALLAGNNFSNETSEGKALFSNSPKNKETTSLIKDNATEKVNGESDLVEDVTGNADFTENMKCKAVSAESMNDEADDRKLDTSMVSVSSSDDNSGKLRIPQFVMNDLLGDLTSHHQPQESVVSSPSKPNRDVVVSDSFADSFATQDGDNNISLLSWLQQNSPSNGNGQLPRNTRTHQSPSSMIPVAFHQKHTSSLHGNQASVEISEKPEHSDSGSMSRDSDNSAVVEKRRLPLVAEVGVIAKSKGSKSEDELDFSRLSGVSKAPKRGSVPAISSASGRTATSSSSSTRQTTTSTATTPVKKRHSLVAGSSSAPVGVDEDIFVKQFDQVTKINVFSAKELTERAVKIRDLLSDPNVDWSKRVDALKEVRACFFAGAKDHADFIHQLPTLELPFQMSVRDLRSQVVREACITIAFMSQELGKEFGHFAESVLPSLITLIPNSAKVMASSATICIRFILQHTHYPRLIPIITGNHTSKASVIRKQCCELLYQIVHTWPTHVLERHIAVLQDAIKRGIGDADSDARVFSRNQQQGLKCGKTVMNGVLALISNLCTILVLLLERAFWAFSEHFKGQADSLLCSLDISKQRQLIGEQQSNSSSNTSLNSIGRSLTSGSLSHRSYKSRSASTERGLSSSGTVRCSSALGNPIHRTNTDHCVGAEGGGRPKQSSSAVDLVSLADSMASLSTMSSSSKAESHRTQQSNYGSLRVSKRASSFSKPTEKLARSCDEKTLSGAMKSARSRKTSLSGGLAPLPTPSSSSSADRSRSRSRVGVSQSQPGSRSNSPAARLSYITHIQPDVVSSTHGPTGRGGKPKAGIAKSQGSSREGSPTRVYGRERRFSGHSGVAPKQRSRATAPQRVLLPGEDGEAAVADALHRPKGKGSSDTYDSDDAASETSSTCSDSSYWACGRQLTEDMSEIISCLSSGAWGDRRDGLMALQNLLNNNRTLTRSELKKVTDIFSRMFHDPHGKVFGVFMETLVDLVAIHHDDLVDWLYILLTRLLSKTGADLLASVQAKVQKALEVVRSTFPSSNQFVLLSKFLIDQTQSPNLKVKVSMLMYLHGLIQLMNPSDFSNTSDIRLAVSRIITWTTEPKSVEVRKAAQAVLIALYNLNTPEFSVMLSVLPKTFQEGANRILQNRLRGSGGQDGADVTPQRGGVPSSIAPSSSSSASFRYKMSAAGRLTRDGLDGGALNTVDIYDSIRQTTNDIHRLIKDDAHGETRDRTHPTLPPPPPPAASSVFPSSSLTSPLTSESRIPTFLHNSTGKPRVKEEMNSFDDHRFFNPCSYIEQEHFPLKMENHLGSDESFFSEEIKSEQGDMIQDILVELSNHNEREEERKSALLVLMKKAREEESSVWDEYFNAVLLMLLETLGDNDGHIRAMALRVLAEFLRCMPDRFQDYVELTTMRTLDAHKDPIKEVTRAAEECITLMARIVPPSRCHVFLKPLIECEDFPVNLAAIKMFTQVIEEHQKDDVIALLPDMVPGLLKGYENSQSSVRKASVVCLVAIYLCVGESLRPFLQDLHGSKVKLLNVYIKKALEEKGGVGGGGNSCATSKASSPTSMADA